jgi:hypothetical protein
VCHEVAWSSNRAGNSTALDAILGLIPYQGELKVLGHDPWTERDQLMHDVSFISDVAVLPRWIRVSQVLDSPAVASFLGPYYNVIHVSERRSDGPDRRSAPCSIEGKGAPRRSYLVGGDRSACTK